MKTLADLLEVIGENGLIISNPKPQASDSLPSTSTEDCFPNAQLCAFPVAILPAGSTPAAILPASSTPAAILPRRLNNYSCGREKPMHLSPKSRFPYQPTVEPITPIKVKKGLKVKNPGFKRHRTFPFSSLPPYKGMKSRENPM